MKKNKNWFTLIEVMIWILITSILIIAGFQALTAILVWKVKLIEETDIEQETFFFSQKLFEEIKKWGTLDYEEYFNRNVINKWLSTKYSSWHFVKASWFWNFWSWWIVWSNTFWDWFYYCRSWNWNIVWTWGCVTWKNNLSFRTWDNWWNFSWKQQRYWEYSFQFMDYNADYNNDGWDEDSDWFISWDSDDEVLDDAPELFKSWTWITELYLISWDKKRRTFFRWNVKLDPNRPASANCDFSNPKIPTWSGCLWTIQFLKLEWKDWWINHNKTWSWLYDWLVDTWLIDKSFTGWDEIVAWTRSMEKYWLDLFDDSINVKQFEILAYPNKDRNLAYNADNIEISPYVRLKITLTPSWKTKTKIKWKVPEFNFSTSINLTDIYSN